MYKTTCAQINCATGQKPQEEKSATAANLHNYRRFCAEVWRNFNEMQMIFTRFRGVTVTPLGGNECIAAYEA